MAFIDLLIVVLAAFGAFTGYRKGLINGIGSVAGLLIGIIVCRLAGDAFYSMMVAWHPSWAGWPGAPYTGKVMAEIILFAIVYAATVIAAGLAKGIIHSLSLGGFDRIGGAAFGALKYLLLLSVVLNLIYVIDPTASMFHSSGLLGGLCLKAVMRLGPWVWGLDVLPNMD